jgi:hypothetical protein
MNVSMMYMQQMLDKSPKKALPHPSAQIATHTHLKGSSGRPLIADQMFQAA